MSASTVSYTSMLGGMWAPEGSEISERLKRLHELEQMRKEREAKRQELLKNMSEGTKSGVGIVRTARVKSNADSGPSAGIGLRRQLSLREETENYGGARPKLGGIGGTGSDDTGLGSATLFSEIKASLLGPRKPLRGDNSISGSSETDLTSSVTYTQPVSTERSYTKSFTSTQNGGLGGSLFSGITSSLLGDKRRPYGNQEDVGEVKGGQNDYEYDHYDNSYSSHHESDGHSETTEEDHGEEPKHFIERLNYGKTNDVNLFGKNQGQHMFQSLPVVPPWKYEQTEEEFRNDEMPEFVQPGDDIHSVAQEIFNTFSDSSSLKSPNINPGDNGEPLNQNESVIYEIHEVNYDTSGDEEGKILPIRESFYNARPSEWGIVGKTPGRIDEMQKYFTGESVEEDPNISRELDGGKVKAELEKSVSEAKNERKRVSDKNSGRKTPTKFKKTPERRSPGSRSKSPLDKLKKSSESENDSVPTSESELESNGLKKPTPRRKIALNTSTPKDEEKNGMSLTDKLAKLESLTQQKQRKQSFGETDIKRTVPSYMSGTSSSERKRMRAKEQSPGPSRDLKKDVQEIKQFLRENSEPNTPVSSPVKSFTESFHAVDKVTKEVSVQTEFVLDFPDINYVCKHCGKSSFDELKSPLTKENINKVVDSETKQACAISEIVKPSDAKFSSKDSVNSVGEASTKSEKINRYKPKAAPGTQSYMRGTTASRLKTNSQTSDAKGRKGSAPEIIHRAEQESAKGPVSLRGNVSDKLKSIEKANRTEKSKPALSLYRGKSVERDKPEVAEKPKLSKSKSVDQFSALQQLESVEITQFEESKNTEVATVTASDIPPSPGVRTGAEMLQKKSSPTSKPPVEKLDLSSLVSPMSPRSPRSPIRKPPVASPRTIESDASPRSETMEQNTEAVESKGQFTKLEDNPFIKNDLKRRNSFKGKDKEESVWEKAGSHSGDSSLERSNSTAEVDREIPSSASLKHHNTSIGEKLSVSELTWSDSGSTGSLKGSRSSLHGSNSSLNRDGVSAFHRPRTQSGSSVTSRTSHNTGLNSSHAGSSRHPVSGAIETDIDAACKEQSEDTKPVVKKDEHNEETVDKVHLEFAKKTGASLKSETKQTTPSTENGHNENQINGNDESTIENGLDKNQNEIDSEKSNGLQTSNGSDVKCSEKGKNNKKQKGRKGFFKAKLSKK